MAGYTKLFSSILDSTVWTEPLATRVVWITMLAMADQDGNIAARAPGIAKRASVTRAECDRALKTFAAPDPDSRTGDHEGRRAVETADGWHLLNYEAYRDRASAAEKAEKNAARQARFRARKAKSNAPITHGNAPLQRTTRVTHSAAEAEASAEATPYSAAGRERAGARVARPVPENRMMDPQPAARPPDMLRADIAWLNQLCAEVTSWTGSLLDGDRLERTAGELVTRAQACAAERHVDHRYLLECVMRRWWSPKRMSIRGKPWVVMALQDWHETLADVDAEQERLERTEGVTNAN